MSKIGFKKRLHFAHHRLIVDENIRKHKLTQLLWESTLRCNLNCAHCGSDCRKLSSQKDMPKEDFLGVIESIYPHIDPNNTLIIMTGGEVLMRKDIEEVGLHLYNKGFPWGIVSNGMALDAKRFDSLVRSGMRTLTVSLDGFESQHNEMRRHKESFSRAVEAVKLAAKQDDHLVWDVVTCVTSKSLETIEEFRDFLYSIGVRRWRIFTVIPMGRAKDDDTLQLSPDKFRKLLDFIKETRAEGKIALSYACEGFLGGYEGEVRNTLYNCIAGVNAASILADGSISGCTSIRSDYYQGNIYTDDFWDVWQNRYEKYRNREWMRKGQCAKCKQFKNCRGGGMHLRDDQGELLLCHYEKLQA